MMITGKCPALRDALAKTHRYGSSFLLLKFLLLLAFAVSLSISARCQQITASLDRDKIVIGEQVTLTLKVTDVDPRLYFLPNWFSFPDSINHIAIIKKDEMDTIDVGGFDTYLQHFTITSYDSGKWSIPLQAITIQERATGKKTTLKADSVFLQVLPVDVSGLKDYHDIKDIIDVPEQHDYTMIIAATISAVVVVVLLILLLRRKKKPVAIQKVPRSTRPPLDEALFKLHELDHEGLPAKGEIKLFFITLDEICREYYSARLHADAMHLTNEELFPLLGVYLQDKAVRGRYEQLMGLIASAKFAKYLPGREETEEALHLAAFVLKYIDSQIETATKHAN